MDMISITRESVHILSKNEYSDLNSEHVPDALLSYNDMKLFNGIGKTSNGFN
jgi:hypothetical protein